MASPAIQVCLQTIRDLLVEETRFLYGVSDAVEKVERELNTIHCILMDADKWQDKHKTAILRDWTAQLNELASRAEYVLEKYAVEVTSRRRGGNLIEKVKRFSCILGECSTVHQIGEEIEAIRSSLTVLTGKLQVMAPWGSSSSSREDQQHLLRITFKHVVKQHFVGMEKDIESLVSLVKDKSNPVISIYGMGGLGKTTLARKIYHHEDVIRVFGKARAWVCVTQQFQATVVLRQILKQLLPDEEKEQISNMEYSELVDKLHDVQMQKKCFVVIDDIWESDHWSILERAFAMENGQCKILLTTRYETVGPRECLYKLHCLTKDQGWELLQKIALPRELNTKQSSVLEAIGRQMVQKCGRLPLAITVLGGILREKSTPSEWQKVNEDVDSYLKRGNEKVKQVLDLSYNALPYNLKPCFLYLGCFPEDEEIDAGRLYLLWMADSLIPYEEKGKNETLRDVAERYLSELASRCMVQVQKDEYSSAYNKFTSCRLHDLMRDLCLSKGQEKGFLKLVDLCKQQAKYDSTCVDTASRLAIHYNRDHSDEYFNRRGVVKNLRSLLLVNEGWSNVVLKIGSKGCGTDFNKLKRLRTLALESGEFVLSKEVGKLIHLRYLSLFGSIVVELPLSITNLTYLQTLDLRMMLNFINVSNVIFKMKRLKHLFLNQIQVIGDYGDKLILNGLEEFETLHDESFTSCVHISDIPRLTNLRYLKTDVSGKDELSIIANYMSSENILLREAHLQISRCDFNSEEPSNNNNNNNLKNMLMSPSLTTLVLSTSFINFIFPRYQRGMCTNLVNFTLRGRGRTERDDLMEILGQFPTLKKLTLYATVFLNREMKCLATSFPQLKYLTLTELHNLERWVVDKGAMPNLSRLRIYSCDGLEMIPDGLQFITTLQELETYMAKEFNDRLREEVNGQPGQDYHKLRHVPSILLKDRQ
ncbi:hypothetical protein ABFS82_07G059900 [Erythranthe guttata]|uniref:NB-ARC domain-containing protein n=1 Tax=Erythranthe guttata TaxID=4155 RepID=A0A022QV03_ERYGU|nr:hypothetical protein MIMGU_mgv1a023294mg [Erythranthe guttata]